MIPSDPALEQRTCFRRPTTVVAWVVLLVALVHPVDGLGVPLCWLESAAGVPCPGCGLTRSFSCAVRGMFEASWHYHPFGIVFLLGFAAVAMASLLPAAARRRLADFTGRHVRGINLGYGVLIGTFLAYGAVRAVVHCLHDL